MVLILLSSPNHLNPVWPATPRSMNASPAFPRTPLTPSPSFFAILSPIFTSDDNGPASPNGFLQLSPGMIPPETPPPWLLTPQSPSISIRPSLSRITSHSNAPRPTPSRAITSDRVVQCQQQHQRPAFPSTTYSFSTGYAQAFRPPPPNALQSIRTRPSIARVLSQIQPALDVTPNSIPELKVRPPSQERLDWMKAYDRGHIQDSEAEVLTVTMMTSDINPSSPTESESMEIPIALALETPPTPWSTILPGSPSMQWQEISSRRLRSIDRVQHIKSPSAPSFSKNDITTLFRSSVKEHVAQPYKSTELGQSGSYRMAMSVANLTQFDKEMGYSHLQSRQILL